VACGVKHATKADGLNLGMNDCAAAGQIIYHAHSHIIPRFKNDGLKHWPSQTISEEELSILQKEITAELTN